MVIQSNMSPKAIVEVWESTAPIFEKFNVQLTNETMETMLGAELLTNILIQLNAVVGSSAATCIEGG